MSLLSTNLYLLGDPPPLRTPVTVSMVSSAFMYGRYLIISKEGKSMKH